MADKDASDNAEKRTNVLAAVGVGFVCLVIGLPLWWKTTEVYRVSLPYSDIDSLAASKIKYAVDIGVISFLDDGTESLAALSRQLSQKLENTEGNTVIPHYRTYSREASEKEKQSFQSATSIAEFEVLLSALLTGRSNEYYVVLLPKSSKFNTEKATIGNHRLVFMTPSSTDTTKIVSDIASLVKAILIREGTVLNGFNSARGARKMKPDKESLRSVKFHSGYDVVLTLVNPRPDILDVQWNVEAAVNKYLNPLVQLMGNYTSINVKSQMLYFTKLQTKPKKEKNGGFSFSVKELPHMINPLEAKLVSPASTNPELNFLVYIPSRNQHPLHIKDTQGNVVGSNSFLSPQWGGIHIYNIDPPADNDTLPAERTLDMSQVMTVFISQLRLLLNLHSQFSEDVQYLPVGKGSVTEWELDSWIRCRCIENLATSSATLQSLAQLLGKISNIVINDDIGQEVQQAVESMQESLQLLSDGYLIEAYQHSVRAVQASEKAFFDPSLLELLYFPEDQKFAIYIPLFLPISFPVLASLWQSYKWYKGLGKPKEE